MRMHAYAYGYGSMPDYGMYGLALGYADTDCMTESEPEGVHCQGQGTCRPQTSFLRPKLRQDRH